MRADLELLDIARLAAHRAGNLLRARRGELAQVTSEAGRDVKISADIAAEHLILETLSRLAPYRVLSEEIGWVEGDDQAVWVVDPLDGSANYLADWPHCAVSIALMRAGKPVLGVIDMFFLGQAVSGGQGLGCWRNDEAVRVSSQAEAAKSILATGFPARADYGDAAMGDFLTQIRRFRKVRMLGSAACAAAYVATGQAQAYAERGSMLWDVAAGAALVEAAGGQVSLVSKAIEGPYDVAMTNGLIELRWL